MLWDSREAPHCSQSLTHSNRKNQTLLMYGSDKEALEALNNKHKALLSEIGNVIVGQEQVIREVTTAVFAGGHVLLVGVPGLAKTLLVNTIAQSLGLSFNRIQFTPDLMPSDIVGSEILDESRQFKFMKGPLFANIVLADEINRTPPKHSPHCSKRCKNALSRWLVRRIHCPRHFSFWQRKTQSNKKALIRYRKRNWTDSCSTRGWIIRPTTKS